MKKSEIRKKKWIIGKNSKSNNLFYRLQSLVLLLGIVFSLMTPTYAVDSDAAIKDSKDIENGTTIERLLDWSDLLELTGEWPKDIALSANTQYQHWQNVKNDIAEANGAAATESIQDIWAAAQYDDWNDTFVNLCLQHAHVPSEFVPHEINYVNCIDVFKEKQFQLFRDKNDYIPQAGDLVILDLDHDGKANIVGVLSSVDIANITVITGDTESYIQKTVYALDDEKILGYGSTNDAYNRSVSAERNEAEIASKVANDTQEKEVAVAEETKVAADTKGIANSVLEDGKTYIIYGYSNEDGKYHALGESGQIEEVTYAGEEVIVSGSKAVKWTYNEQQKSFCNSMGKYLATTGWYEPLTASEFPQEFVVDHAQGGRISTIFPEGYDGYLTFHDNRIVAGADNSTYFYFALVEEKEPDIGGETPSTPTPESNLKIQKYVDKLGADDQYDLNLTVDGVYAAEGKNKADIIYVVDTTGSMMYSMDGKDRYNKERWHSILASTEYMTNLLKNHPDADIRYSVIFFNEDAKVGQDWTTDSSQVMNALHGYSDSLGGGTNYEAGCQELVDGQLVKKMRPDAERVVVFLSDGEPNMYSGEYGGAIFDTDPDGRVAIEKAKAMLSYLDGIDMFYSIGVGSDILQKSKLEELSSVLVNKGVKTGYSHCNHTEEIKRVFDSIIRSIVKIKYDHVQVADNLSKYAELVEGTKLRITVTDAKGRQVGFSEGDIDRGASLRLDRTQLNREADIKLTYDAQAKKLLLAFPEDYILEDGWKYKLTATIKPTQEAYKEHADKGYPHIGEQDTGTTSSGQQGFYSNDSANLDYVLNDGQGSQIEYPKPVIQVTTKTGSRLPDTGGIGTTWIYTIGILILVVEILSVINYKKSY